MKPKDCTCTGVCLQLPDGSCQRLNKSMDSGNDKIPKFIYSDPKVNPKEKELKDKIMEILLSCDREWEFYDERTCHVEKGKDFDYDVAADRIAEFIVTLPK